MLTQARPRSSPESHICKLIQIVTLWLPPLRSEFKRILEKLLAVVVARTHDGEHRAFRNWHLAHLMVFGCSSQQNSISRSINSSHLHLEMTQVFKLLDVLISDILLGFDNPFNLLPQFFAFFRISAHIIYHHQKQMSWCISTSY